MKKRIIFVILCLAACSACSPKADADAGNGVEAQPTEAISDEGKTEEGLKQPQVFEDVLGTLSEGVYRNKAFGFSMDVNQPGFEASLNPKEDFIDHFDSAGSSTSSDDVMRAAAFDPYVALSFCQSHVEGHNGATAAEILDETVADDHSPVEEKTLGGHTAAYTRAEDSYGVVTEHYAMVVNGFFISWQVRTETSDEGRMAQVQEMLDSIAFDWSNE